MKTLINNIELISFSYMNSNNNTLNKSGIECNYIATAMNNMSGFTDNNIKNMEINKTNAIAIDWNWFNIGGIFLSGSGFEIALVVFLVFGGPVVWVILRLSLLASSLLLGLLSCIY